MTTYGFKDRKDAEKLRDIARAHQSSLNRPNEPQQGPHRPGHHHLHGSGWYAKLPAGEIPARIGTTPGKAVCDIYFINPDEDLEVWTDSDGDTITETIYNVSDEPIVNVSGDDYVLCESLYNRPVASQPPETLIQADLLTCLLYTDDGYATYEGRTIQFRNSIGLDAMPGKVWLTKSGGDWHLLLREKYKARWLAVTKTGESIWEKTAEYDGYDPTPCGYVIECDLDCGCWQPGDPGYAFYDFKNDVYKVVSSDSAVLGPFVSVPVVGGDSPGTQLHFDGCTLYGQRRNVKVPAGCLGDAGEIATAIGTVSITVGTGLSQSGASLVLTKAVAQVCSYVTTTSDTITGTECETGSS